MSPALVDDSGVEIEAPEAPKIDDPISQSVLTARMIDDRILVVPDRKPKQIGGLAVPDTVRTADVVARAGTALVVGPGFERPDGSRTEMRVKVGDKLLFTNHAGHEVPDGRYADGEERKLLVLRQTEVLAILGKPAPLGG